MRIQKVKQILTEIWCPKLRRLALCSCAEIRSKFGLPSALKKCSTCPTCSKEKTCSHRSPRKTAEMARRSEYQGERGERGADGKDGSPARTASGTWALLGRKVVREKIASAS